MALGSAEDQRLAALARTHLHLEDLSQSTPGATDQTLTVNHALIFAWEADGNSDSPPPQAGESEYRAGNPFGCSPSATASSSSRFATHRQCRETRISCILYLSIYLQVNNGPHPALGAAEVPVRVDKSTRLHVY